MQRIVLAMLGAAFLEGLCPMGVIAQPAVEAPSTETAPAADIDQLFPLLPPGISDFNVELYGKLANTWAMPDGTKVIQVRGDFSANMGQYKLASAAAVVWFRRMEWEARPYIELEVFLWQGAEIVQPGGTIERGPALLVTLRTFGTLVLNADSHAAAADDESELFVEGLKARGLLDQLPPAAAEKADTPVQVAPTAEELALIRPKQPKRVEFSVDPDAGNLEHEQHGDQSVIIATGDVFVSQGTPAESGEYVEIRADAAVLFLRAEKVGDVLPGLLGEEQKPEPPREVKPGDLDAMPESQPTEPPLLEQDKAQRQSFSEWVSAVYLEGDVVLTRGQRMIRATKLYYDFEAERALILDVVMRAYEPTRNLPIYVRADEVRQLSSTDYVAEKARITTSEFHTPHVAIAAGKVYLKDRTRRDETGQAIGVEAGTYKAYNTTMDLEGVPVAYWPFSQGDFSRDRMAFRSAKFGYSGDLGAAFETRWYLFNLLGMEQPEGYDATLKLDYFTDRGPGVGIDMDYEQEDYYGLLRTYYVKDNGEDDLGGDRGGEPSTDDRGRVLWRHRQFLPKDWELTLETAYVSDNQYLEAWERNEFENGKEQETAIYLVKRQDNWQFSTLANWRLNEWETQTEHLPEGKFTLIGEPLGEFATLYHDSSLGVIRRRVDNRRFVQGDGWYDNQGETGSVVRGDIRDELQFPLPELGPIKVTPYVSGRETGWDDSPRIRGRSGGGGRDRFFGTYGLHSNVMFSKVDDTVESELLDLHRMRHVVKVDANAFNAHANQAPEKLSPFTGGVEDIDDFGGATVGVRQRWQTQRGGPGKWRTVDWITFDLEAGFFNNSQENENTHGDYIASRPEDSLSSNFLAMNFQNRISDSTVLVYDGVYDTNRGNMGTSNISLAVEREPRLAYFVGWRYIHDTANSLIGAGANYKLSEKHTVGIREYYDVQEGRNYSTELVYIRKWPRWYTAVAFDIDRAVDDMGINFSFWPEGAPQLGLGSKRFTGLTDSVGIRP